MKNMRTIASVILFLAAVSAASAQGKFILEGTVDAEDGIVKIWKHEYECLRDSTDLIATTEVKNGHFRIECDNPGVLACRVYRTGHVGWSLVFPEPCGFSSHVGEKNRDLHFTGGRNQQIFNEYLAIQTEAWRKYQALLAEYDHKLDKNFDRIRPRANVILKELIASLDGFFRQHAEEEVAAYVLYQLSVGAEIGTPDTRDIQAKYNMLADGPRNSTYARKALEMMRKQ